MTWHDKTYCASPNCKNKCGRKMPPEIKKLVKESNWPVWYGYFCGDE